MPVYLTKSRYAAGEQCLKRLWLDVHAPAERGDPDPGSTAAIGEEIGRGAHFLFPGGVLVDEKPWEHSAAAERTRTLMMDASVPAIFEAAFEHGGVRVRVDVLERLPRGWWGLREVKSSGEVKDHYLPDVAIQLHVLRGAGLRIASVEVLHVDKDYVRASEEILWTDFFRRVELKKEAKRELDGIKARISRQLGILRRSKAPAVDPSGHCHSPYSCNHWENCTASKPRDWILNLPRLRAEKQEELAARGIERISAIPDDFEISPRQAMIRDVTRSGKPFVSADLKDRLEGFGPPAFYLDFEAFMPAIPIYANTRPYEVMPFQWSLHQVDRRGRSKHREFLADGHVDPRRPFAETLVAALEGSNDPIVVYSSYEKSRLKDLAVRFPDLRKRIGRIVDRLADLLPLVSSCVYHPEFAFSDSIKTVAPALCPDLSYEDLEIADGGAASTAFWLIASGRVDVGTAKHLRNQLREYCKRDTWALVRTHEALRTAAKDRSAQGLNKDRNVIGLRGLPQLKMRFGRVADYDTGVLQHR